MAPGDGPTDNHEILGFGTMFIAYALIYFGINEIRKSSKRWNFGKAFGSAIAIVGISCVVYVLGWIQYSSSHPGVMNSYFDQQIEKMREEYADQPEVLELMISDTENWKAKYNENAPITWIFTFMEPLPVGVLFSLIWGIALRKPQDE